MQFGALWVRNPEKELESKVRVLQCMWRDSATVNSAAEQWTLKSSWVCEILTDATSFNIRKFLTWPSFLKVHFGRRVLNMLINFGTLVFVVSLTIIPRARMGSESIAHEVEGRMGYWLRGHEGERNNCFSKIQLVGQKYRDKTTFASKTWFSRHCFGFQSRRFSLLVGYNMQPSSSLTSQNAALIIDH